MILDKIVAILDQVAGIKEVTLETEIESLGLDSIDSSEFYMEIEEEFDINKKVEWEKCKTIEDVVNMVKANV